MRVAALTGDVLRDAPRRGPWSPSVVLWVLLACVAVALWRSVVTLGGMWSDVADYQHGWAIALACIVWLHTARDRIDAGPIRPQPFALPALAVVLAAWLVGHRANSEILQQLMLPLAAICAVWAAFGPTALRQVAAPLAFLYFAIPIWDQFVPALQALTVWVVELLLGAIGVPVEVEGHQVTSPAGSFSIAEGCSGKRYLVVALASGALAAALQGLRGGRAVWLMLVAAGAALVTNWLRVLIIIYAGHVTDMQHYLVAVEHRTLGYVLFAPMLLIIVVAARRLGRGVQPRRTIAPQPARAGLVLLAGVAGPLILLGAPLIFSATEATVVESSKAALAPLPVLAGEWQGPLPADESWSPRFVGAADEQRASYAAGAKRIELYLNSYGTQRPGRELIFHLNSVAPEEQWTLVGSTSGGQDGLSVLVAADLSGARWVIAQTHLVGSRVIVAPALAQLYYGLLSIRRPAPAGVIAFATPCAPDCDAAASAIDELWRDAGERFANLIPRAL